MEIMRRERKIDGTPSTAQFGHRHCCEAHVNRYCFKAHKAQMIKLWGDAIQLEPLPYGTPTLII